MKTKIPPPVVAILTAVIIWLISEFDTVARLEVPYLIPIAVVVFLGGLVINITSLLAFRRAKTAVNPMNPEKASTLVTTGVFKFSRNPMYLSLLVMLTAMVIWLGSPLAICCLVIYVLYMNKLQIEPEEAAMEKLFTHDYANYKSEVGRWI